MTQDKIKKFIKKHLKNDYFTKTDAVKDLTNLLDNCQPKDIEDLDFGDYCTIEQKRHSVPNEIYVHKVIGRFESNSYVDVPVQSPRKETTHDKVVKIIACITCGVSEKNVLKYKLTDVKLLPQPPKQSAKKRGGCNP